MSKVCPTCGQTVERSGKVCALCHMPILRHHKFVFEGSTVRHRVCTEPEAYTPSQAVYQKQLEEPEA